MSKGTTVASPTSHLHACPLHRAPEAFDGDVHAFGPEGLQRKVVAGALGLAGMLGVCSCSNTTNPDASPTAVQTTQVSPSPSPESTTKADALPTSPQDFDWQSWPSLQADYVYSDTPQGVAEQWIADTYPALWAAGVRATFPGTQYSWDLENDSEPEIRVQYLNGIRYEGTQSMPLGFGENATDGTQVRSDTWESSVKAMLDPSLSARQAGNIGFGAYSIMIAENIDMQRGATTHQGNDVEVLWSRIDDRTFPEQSMRFGEIDEALAWLDAHDWTYEGAERTLSMGEFAHVVIYDETKPGKAWDLKMLNPDTGKYEYIRSLGG